jgi:hypothetical protein
MKTNLKNGQTAVLQRQKQTITNPVVAQCYSPFDPEDSLEAAQRCGMTEDKYGRNTGYKK